MQEQSNQDRSRAQVFRRELPGGGYVVIGIERPTGDRPVARTCVWVERRTRDGRLVGAIADERQSDATGDGREVEAPIIAAVDGDEQSAAFTEMYRLAADNAAVARGLMHWRASRAQSIQRAD